MDGLSQHLSPSFVVETLGKACSQDPSILKPAENQLKQFETLPGFYSILSSVFLEHSHDEAIRWLSVLYFKNGIDRFWRRNAPNAISEEEETYLKNRLLSGFEEPNQQIAVQIAVLIGKIARLDCPHKWPQLIPTIIQSLMINADNNLTSDAISPNNATQLGENINVFFESEQTGQTLDKLNLFSSIDEIFVARKSNSQCMDFLGENRGSFGVAVQNLQIRKKHRALLTLHHVVKALASKRLVHDKKIFQELTSNILDLICNMWKNDFNKISQAFETSNLQLLELSMKQSLLTLKILKKLIVFGIDDYSKCNSAKELISMIFQTLNYMLLTKRNYKHIMTEEVLTLREKQIVLHTKLLLEVLDNNAESFAPFLQSSLQLTYLFCFNQDNQDVIFERFIVNSMNLMRNILKCDKYKMPKSSHDLKNQNLLEAYRIRSTFMSKEILNSILEYLILHYFILTQQELELWQSDPEAYVSEESGDSCKYSLRPCSEMLYLMLMKEYRETACDLVLQLIKNHQQQILDSNNLQAILSKDAVYNAMGLASFDLFDLIDFDEWFVSKLYLELQNKNSNQRILVRRVIWLIGSWVGVKFSKENRPHLYQLLSNLLNNSEDIVIRMQALNTLKIAVDDLEFTSEQYFPFLEIHFKMLYQLLTEVTECETKMSVLHVMSLITERMQENIKPHIASLIHYLPMLWQASKDHNMLRCAIINNLNMTVQGIGSDSTIMHGILLHVIETSLDTKSQDHVYLCEDALELWLNTLHACTQPTADLLNLFQNLIPLFEIGSESLKISLKIIEAYFLLSPVEFLQKYQKQLSLALLSSINEIKEEGQILIYKLLSVMLMVQTDLVLNTFQTLFYNLITFISNPQINCSTTSYLLTTSIIEVMSRVVISNSNSFLSLVQNFSQQNNYSPSVVMDTLIEGWIVKSDFLMQPEKKKLSAMALVLLIPLNIMPLMTRFYDLMLLCIDVLHEVCKVDSLTNLMIDNFVVGSGKSGEAEDEHHKRKYELWMQDPLYKISLSELLSEQLNLIQSNQDTFGSVFDQLDYEITQQLKHFLNFSTVPSIS